MRRRSGQRVCRIRAGQAGPRRLQEGFQQCVVNASCPGTEFQVTAGLRRAREPADVLGGAPLVRVEVQRGAVVPDVAARGCPRAAAGGVRRVGCPAAAHTWSKTQRMVRTVGPASTRVPRTAISRILPPGPAARSSTVTRWPRAASSRATTSPPMPAPITAMERCGWTKVLSLTGRSALPIVRHAARDAASQSPLVCLARPAVDEPGLPALRAGFAFTRFLARRRSKALFDLCAGFVYSQVLLAVVRLRLLELVRSGPLPLGDLRTALDLPR